MWVVFSVLWGVLVAVVSFGQMNIAWSLPGVVHVKMSDSETWDYPAGWGARRIRLDIVKRLDEKRQRVDEALSQRHREWAATVPQARKDECRIMGRTRSSCDMPEDCLRLGENGLFDRSDHKRCLSVEDIRPREEVEASNAWKDEVSGLPMSVWQAATEVTPWMFGPPLVVLAIGASLLWAFAGFRHDPAGG